jgi:uncharacterized protein (DUF433 family)
MVMSWDECDLVERVPGLVNGRSVVKGTRVEAETILVDYELGSPVEEIHENFPTVSLDTIRKLLAFAHSRQTVA